MSPPCQIIADDLETKAFSKRIENALNKKDLSFLINILPNQDASQLKNRYEKFISSFPNMKWTVQEKEPLADGRLSFEVLISGEKQLNAERFSIKAKQIYAFKTFEGEIINKELLSEETILQNSQKPLEVILNIPDTVLTGTNYDFDVIIYKPLGNSIIAGALIAISQEQINNQLSPTIDLAPLGGGGLFKSVKAPSKEGLQSWAAVLAHPEGLLSITKRVRVVALKSDL